ncbi:hypothetical protein Pfo_003497 [Paulownia fortunei]|nr:hypothetical protein Pfo_003497 [Paulownia fortunei]
MNLQQTKGPKKPAWLEALYLQKFFAPCSIHDTAKKNEKNICCLDCCTSICPHCVLSHRSHRLLQIRRYVYHEVVRLEDLEKLMDCSNIQAYTINAAKVLFIKKRPQNRQFKGSGNYCTSCDRSLQEPFIHCSLGCKPLSSSSGSENMMSFACTEFVRKKRSGLYVCGRLATKITEEDMATSMSRRKGVPHRSPLC